MRIICGYTVNLDSVTTIRGDLVAGMIADRGLTERVLERVSSPREKIYDVEDFFSGLLLSMERGSGAEWLIFDHKVFDFLKEHFFEESRVILGGNSGNMANVLSDLGAEEIVINTESHSKALGDLLGCSVRIPKRMDGRLVLAHPMDAGFEVDRDVGIHFVFNFNRGTRVMVGDMAFVVPHDDRFIATYDPANIALVMNPEFEEYCERFAPNFDGAILSGFHLLLTEYSDGTTYKDKIDRLLRHVSSWKNRNPHLFVHLELGYFNSVVVESYLLDRLSGVDSLGMNEIELARCSLLGDDARLRSHIDNLDIKGIVEGASGVLSLTDLSRVCVHTGEFVVSVFKSGFIDPSDEAQALEFGVRAAASYAETGRHLGRDRIEQFPHGFSLSRGGRVEVLELLKLYSGCELAGGSCFAEVEDYCVVGVPVLRCETPVTTVGLGDTFTAATFLRELELAKNKSS